MRIKAKCEQWVARAKKIGTPLVSYPCPQCHGIIATRRAPDGQVWDSLAACPHCEDLHFKIVRGGEVEAHKVTAA